MVYPLLRQHRILPKGSWTYPLIWLDSTVSLFLMSVLMNLFRTRTKFGQITNELITSWIIVRDSLNRSSCKSVMKWNGSSYDLGCHVCRYCTKGCIWDTEELPIHNYPVLYCLLRYTCKVSCLGAGTTPSPTFTYFLTPCHSSGG